MEEGHDVTVLDRLDHSGNLNRLHEIGFKGTFIYHDLRAPINSQLAAQLGRHDWLIHMAAATHVDRSIEDPMSFVQDNVVATCVVLDYAKKMDMPVLYFSTDEVFGPAPPGVSYREDDRYRSANPYAATKAGAEELCVAYSNTYKLPVIITHTMNVFGPRQHPEKFIPNTIVKVRNHQSVTIHANASKTKAGSRFYIHAAHVADALLFLLKHGRHGEKYNIVGQREVDNLELAKLIAKYVGNKLIYEMVDFHSARPGHDLRYALDGGKLARLGWEYPSSFEESLSQTVWWTLNNPKWLLDSNIKEAA